MKPGNTAQGRRTRGQHQWSPSPRHAHMITPDHEDEESLLSLSISRVRNLHLISAALAVTAAAVDDRVEPSCAPPSASASVSLSAQALKSDRGGAARRRGAKRRTAEKTPTTIDHSNGGGERRGRERERGRSAGKPLIKEERES